MFFQYEARKVPGKPSEGKLDHPVGLLLFLFAFFAICVKLKPMLKIRLQRIGRKNDPAFRVVLTDSKNSTKSGRFLEVLGTYNPKAEKGTRTNFSNDRIKYWTSKGAKLSDTMHNFLVHDKVIEGKKINALPKKKPTVKRKELKAKK